MADLYASRGPVRLNDGTADANNAVVANAAPGASDYALATRQVGIPAAAAMADAFGNPTTVPIAAFLMGWNGTNWDRVDTANTGRLQVDVVTGGGSNASVFADSGAFTPDTSSITAIGGLFDDTAGAALAENDVAAIRIDSKRALIGVIEDATTRSQKLAVSSAGAASVNLLQVASTTAITAGVNGSIASGGALAHDAAAAALFPTLMGGYANAAAPADVTADVDAVRAWFLRNGSQVVNIAAGGTLWTNMGQAAASGQFVRVTDGTTTAAVIAGTTALKTDLSSVAGTATVTGGVAGVQAIGGPTASDAAIAAQPLTIGGRASTAVPTAVSADGDVVDARFLRTGALTVHVVDAAGAAASLGGGTQYVGDAPATATPTGTISMGLANAAAPTDVSANADAVALWALRNGSLVVNLAAGGALQAATALSDAFSNPTPIAFGAFGMGYNGATWDRIRVANTGRLQVDVVTGGGSPAASELPSGYNALVVYGTTSGTASGATASVTTNTPANTKLFYVRSVQVSASGATKYQVKFGATVLATGFLSSSGLSQLVRFDPPLSGTGDGTTALTIDVTNREASAMDLYARMGAIVQA